MSHTVCLNSDNKLYVDMPCVPTTSVYNHNALHPWTSMKRLNPLVCNSNTKMGRRSHESHVLVDKWFTWKFNGNFRIRFNGGTLVPYKAKFCGDILYGRYLQRRFLKWPLITSFKSILHHRDIRCWSLAPKILHWVMLWNKNGLLDNPWAIVPWWSQL